MYRYIILEWVNIEEDRLDDRNSLNCVAHYADTTGEVYDVLCKIAGRRSIDIKTTNGIAEVHSITTIHRILLDEN